MNENQGANVGLEPGWWRTKMRRADGAKKFVRPIDRGRLMGVPVALRVAARYPPLTLVVRAAPEAGQRRQTRIEQESASDQQGRGGVTPCISTAMLVFGLVVDNKLL